MSPDEVCNILILILAPRLCKKQIKRKEKEASLCKVKGEDYQGA